MDPRERYKPRPVFEIPVMLFSSRDAAYLEVRRSPLRKAGELLCVAINDIGAKVAFDVFDERRSRNMRTPSFSLGREYCAGVRTTHVFVKCPGLVENKNNKAVNDFVE